MDEFIDFGNYNIKKSSVIWIREMGTYIEMALSNGHVIKESYSDADEYFNSCARLSLIFDAEITG